MAIFNRLLSSLAVSAVISMAAIAQSPEDFVPYKQINLRLPAVPLLMNDPYFSIWSNYDELNAGVTRHWCEQEKAIDGLLRVDGTTYRFMGAQQKIKLYPLSGMVCDGDSWSGKVSCKKQDGSEWVTSDFNDSDWKNQTAAWGTPDEYANVNTPWRDSNSDVYVRRTVTLTSEDLKKDLWVKFSHDDVFELYINGVKIVSTGETWKQDEKLKLTEKQKSALKSGKNVIAAHCHNTTGGAYLDFGLYVQLNDQGSAIQMAKQTSVNVLATSSYYTFTCGPVKLDLVFTAPMLIDDLDLISTPINYISYQVSSLDSRKHDIQFYLGTTPQLTVNEMNQPTLTNIVKNGEITYAKTGSEAQNVLSRSGDQISIDWGYLYVPAINGQVSVASQELAESTFVTTGNLPKSETSVVRSTSFANMPSISFMNNLGNVKNYRNFMLIGYDEVYDMKYMGKNYKAYYARNGKTIFTSFEELRDNYSSIMARCRALDKMIYDDALAAGNVKYAEQLSGCYRLVMAAHKLFEDNTGKPLYFSKENKSNGCVNTVDLTYPSSPLYLLYNPELLKGMILSILDYALSDARKEKNCAAHDLGQYPLANGQVYGDTMPLEESANIIILADAICRITGDGKWLMPYNDILKIWAEYCRAEGQNPGNQLCTDDFKGPSEQNTNLSVKAILAIAAYANLLPYINGNIADVEKYMQYAKNMALLWEADARNGNHYRMGFNMPDTWSLKYNLVWDKLWGLNLFPKEIYNREIDWYLSNMNKYGTPLDNRVLRGGEHDTKSDWLLWVAAMAPDNETFLKFSDCHYNYINETTSRIPLSDWYDTNTGRSISFSARSVIGGLWMKVLMDRHMPKYTETGWTP